MKADYCSICDKPAKPFQSDVRGHGALFGVRCDEGHTLRAVFTTKNRAIQAWNECQGFVLRYTEVK